MEPLKIFSYIFKLFQDVPFIQLGFFKRIVEAMIDMILDKFSFCLGDCFLNSVQLLSDVHTISTGSNHFNDTTKMPLGTF